MKCPYCGAQIDENSYKCEYCDSVMKQDPVQKAQAKKPGCPTCGSKNVEFNREKTGEVRGQNGVSVVYSTVGICRDCGFTWDTANAKRENVRIDPTQGYQTKSYQTNAAPARKSGSMFWWVMGWLFFFPAPIMVLIWRDKCKWSFRRKLIVTIIFWVVLVGLGSSDDSSSEYSMVNNPVVQCETMAQIECGDLEAAA